MDNARRPDLDAGRALQQMELMAWSEGMGTCFVGMRQTEQQQQIKELLGVPETMELITVLPLGYRVEGTRQQGIPRKPMAEIVHRGKFGQRFITGRA
jgi:nitroreductase